MSDELLIDAKGESLFLTLNRPEKRNALNLSIIRELLKALQKAYAEPHLKAIIFQGSGTNFCSGLDLNEAKDASSALYEEAGQLLLLIYHAPVTTLCVVHGATFAGGIGIMGASDYVIASSEASFCLPEVKLGLIPALVICLLKRQLAPRFIRELSLIGVPINSERAKEIGLINQIVAPKLLQEELTSLVEKLSKNSFSAMKHLKKLLREFEVPTLEEEFSEALKAGKEARLSADAQRSLSQFLKKEKT